MARKKRHCLPFNYLMNNREKAIKLSKSIRFSTLWRIEDQNQLKPLFIEFKEKMKLTRIYKVHEISFDIMIANLLNAYQKKQVLSLYLSAGLSYDVYDLEIKIPAKHFSRIIKFLVSKKIISFYRGYKNKKKSMSSKIIVEDEFINWVPAKTKQLKVKPPLIILKNNHKQIIKIKTEGPRIKWLREYNDLLYKTYISIGSELLNPQQLYRVYNGNFHSGGRFYGGDFQLLSKKDRKKILINGLDCVELDYHCLHIHLLYFKENLKLEGDAYLLPSYGSYFRSFVKFALMIILNAPSLLAAKRAIAFKALKLKLKIDINHLINELETRHAAIAHNFYRAEVAGILQNIESNIAANVIRYFTSKKIPILPIHDGFIIQAKYLNRLKTQMRKSFQYYTGTDFKIPVLRA